jgi:hypothetical protein
MWGAAGRSFQKMIMFWRGFCVTLAPTASDEKNRLFHIVRLKSFSMSDTNLKRIQRPIQNIKTFCIVRLICNYLTNREKDVRLQVY